eukprot:s1035_g7.t1
MHLVALVAQFERLTLTHWVAQARYPFTGKFWANFGWIVIGSGSPLVNISSFVASPPRVQHPFYATIRFLAAAPGNGPELRLFTGTVQGLIQTD